MSRRGLLLVIDYHIDRQKRLREEKGDPHGSPTPLVDAPEMPDDPRQILKWEREYLGVYLSDDPLAYVAATSIGAEIGDSLTQGRVEITGVALDVTHKRTRSGVAWATFGVLDRSGVARCVGFGESVAGLAEGRIGWFRGDLVRRDEEVQIKVYASKLMEQF